MAISITERSSFLLIYLLALSFAAFQFQLGSSRFSANFFNQTMASPLAPTTGNAGTTVIFPLSGNVYPTAYYSALLDIGQPPKTYDFDIDTGSSLAWVKCDAPKPMENKYKPKMESFVRCSNPICDSVRTEPCKSPEDKCDYYIKYMDESSSSGFLVTDNFPLHLTNGTVISPRLVFGCGIKQVYSKHHPSPTAGMLGLTDGKISILSQLRSAGIFKNVVGHCLRRKGGGFMFLGDVPALPSSSNIAWVPRTSSSLMKDLYSAGPAELFHGGKPTPFKGLQIIFDSGSTFTSLTSELYKALVFQVKEDLKNSPLKVAKVPRKDLLQVCWKDKKPIKSVDEVKRFFQPFMLRFANNKELQIPPEAYIIVDKVGQVCLGIEPLNTGPKGIIILADISMQDMMMIFDNENKQIGWVSADCNSIHKS